MRYLATILLTLACLAVTTAAVFLAIDGNLSALTGWYRFEKGGRLFESQSSNTLSKANWIRIEDLHETIKCEKDAYGAWWITEPFKDRMSQQASSAILQFTQAARLVDTLPLNNTTRISLREFGVETSPHRITLKMPQGDGHTTLARYTLGSVAPWFTASEDGETMLPTTYMRTDFYGRDKRIHVVTGNILPLFKDGLRGLRDPKPLQIQPENVLALSIKNADDQLLLNRVSAEASWNITSPMHCAADNEVVNNLIKKLSELKSPRVQNKQDIELPDEKLATSIRLQLNDGEEVTLHIYPAHYSEKDDMMVQLATCSDRNAVFSLQAEPRVQRSGQFSKLLNAAFELPVLPSSLMAKIKTGEAPIYSLDLPLSFNELRSRKFSNIHPRDISRIALRSRYSPDNLILLMIPGDKKSQVDDLWQFSLGNKPYAEAESSVVSALLNAISEVPVDGFVADIPFYTNPAKIINLHGLDQPDYTLTVLPRPCAFRSLLYGVDIPLIKDREPAIYYIKRVNEPTGDGNSGYWIGWQRGSASIYKISSKLTRYFSQHEANWKKHQVLRFSAASLSKLTLDYQKAKLILDYDYIDESWTGTLNGKDVSPNINPHRASHYLQTLQKLEVQQWLDRHDESALRALKKPIFSIKLDIKVNKINEQSAVILTDSSASNIEQQLDYQSSKQREENYLSDQNDQTSSDMRNIAMADYHVIKRSYTIQIAPISMRENTRFYARILETGELFIISNHDALSLSASVLD